MSETVNPMSVPRITKVNVNIGVAFRTVTSRSARVHRLGAR